MAPAKQKRIEPRILKKIEKQKSIKSESACNTDVHKTKADLNGSRNNANGKQRPSNDTPSDDRFTRLFTDPRFRSLPKFERKVKLDPRFKAVLTDRKFQSTHVLDKRGRSYSSLKSEQLDRLYAVDDDSKPTAERNEPEDDEAKSSDNEEVDYSRGFGNAESSSDEEGDDDEVPLTKFADDPLNNEPGHQLQVGDDEYHWTNLDHDAERSNKITRRLAVMNQDWDRITAQDLFVLFSSVFSNGLEVKKKSGRVKNVKIFLSQFGSERLAEEAAFGPKELRELRPSNTTSSTASSLLDEGVDKITTHQRAAALHKVREYQINRLKYYYAVVECSTAKAANTVYEHCDGTEFEVSGCRLDLRFIPDDTNFDDKADKMKDSFDDSMQIDSNYAPQRFSTQAVQQSKVECSWDEDEPQRQQKMRATRNIDDAEDLDDEEVVDGLDEFLASDTSGDEEQDDQQVGEELAPKRQVLADDEADEPESLPVRANKSRKRAYQQMLKSLTERDAAEGGKRPYKTQGKTGVSFALDDKDTGDDAGDDRNSEDDVDMELSWQPTNFKTDDKPRPKPSDRRETEKLRQQVKRKKQTDTEADSSEDDGDDAAVKQTTRYPKFKSTKANFSVDVDDARFSALYTSPDYNLDVSDPKYKPTDGMQQLIRRKLDASRSRHVADSQTVAASTKDLPINKVDLETKSLLSRLKTKSTINRSLALKK